jgi:SAM-dependent methyltransferase
VAAKASLKDQIAALKRYAEGNPAAMLALAPLLRDDGQGQEALALCRRALALAPDDAELAAKARFFIAAAVPDWHFIIVKDAARNAAYDAALRRSVTPGSRVLEIGTGTGLLAMMAARAGAAEVITCEANPEVAEAAAGIVALNGYGDRVRLVAKHSDRLDAETDMGGLADILVSEIVSNNLLGEHVLPAHERAVRDLLKPGARVIPARGTVRIALAYDNHADARGLATVEGFDLSPFNALAAAQHGINIGDERLELRGEAADLFSFDFASADYAPPAQAVLECRSNGGTVNGVAQWILLEMDEVTRYENRPAAGATSCWRAMFHPLAQPIETTAGQALRVVGSHDRTMLTIWIEPADESGRADHP